MKTLTLSSLSDGLHLKLAERAAANHCSVEEEAVRCLQLSVEDEALLDNIPAQRWEAIETSLVAALRETPSDLTDEDSQRYRNLARGRDAR
jgi:plasmid stability protein